MVGRISNCEMLARGGRETTKMIASATSAGARAPSLPTCCSIAARMVESEMPPATSVVVAPGSMMQTRIPTPPTSCRNHSPPFIQRQRFHASRLDDSSRIDEDFDPAKPADGILHRPAGIAFDRHIAGQSDGLSSLDLDAPDEVIEPVLASRRNGHGRTGVRQRQRGRFTDTRRSTCNQRHLACKHF